MLSQLQQSANKMETNRFKVHIQYCIGDDTPLFAHIQEGYRYGRFLQKLEYANLVTRALNGKLQKLRKHCSPDTESKTTFSSACR